MALGARKFRSIIDGIAEWLATRAGWWTTLAVTCVTLLVPLFLVDIPPLLDYPNHLARMYVLAFGAQDPILSRMYEQHWAIIPNLAIDLIVPAMLHIMPVYTAGRIVLAAMLLLPLAATIVYHRVAFGVRSYWPLVSALCAYHALFLLGFMNFVLSLGMALLVAAAWLYWRNRHPLLLTLGGMLATVAIFFMHIFGLVFLAVLICGEELARLRAVHAAGRSVRSHLQRPMAMGILLFAPPAVLLIEAPLLHVDGATIYRPLWRKLLGLAEPFLTYDLFIDALTAVIFLACLCIAWPRSRPRFAPGVVIALAILFAVYLVCPFATMGGGFFDSRFPIMLGLLLFAGFRPMVLSTRARLTIGTILAALFVVRMASLATVWYDHNRDLADFRQVISSVQPGDRVLVVSVDPGDSPDYQSKMPRGRRIPGFFRLDFHLPALLTIERHAFIPYLFADRTQQPLQARPPYDRLSVPLGQPPGWQSLVTGVVVHPVTSAPYLADWQHRFDYVLLLNAGAAGDLSAFLPNKLRLVAARDVAALYRVRAH